MSVGKVSGGKETNPLWISQVDNESFGGALMQSLQSQGLFVEDGNYSLQVEFLESKQPMWGANTTVATRVKYLRTDLSSSKTNY